MSISLEKKPLTKVLRIEILQSVSIERIVLVEVTVPADFDEEAEGPEMAFAEAHDRDAVVHVSQDDDEKSVDDYSMRFVTKED